MEHTNSGPEPDDTDPTGCQVQKRKVLKEMRRIASAALLLLLLVSSAVLLFFSALSPPLLRTTENLTIGGDYELDHFLYVPRGQTLTIEKGSTIFCDNGGILCYGELNVAGSKGKVQFKGKGSKGFYGIRHYSLEPLELSNFSFEELKILPLPGFFRMEACFSEDDIERVLAEGFVEHSDRDFPVVSSLMSSFSLKVSESSVKDIVFPDECGVALKVEFDDLPLTGCIFYAFELNVQNSSFSHIEAMTESDFFFRQVISNSSFARDRMNTYADFVQAAVENVSEPVVYKDSSFTALSLTSFDQSGSIEAKRYQNCTFSNLSVVRVAFIGNAAFLDCHVSVVEHPGAETSETAYVFENSEKLGLSVENSAISVINRDGYLALVRGIGKFSHCDIEFKGVSKEDVRIAGGFLFDIVTEDSQTEVSPGVLSFSNCEVVSESTLACFIADEYCQLELESTYLGDRMKVFRDFDNAPYNSHIVIPEGFVKLILFPKTVPSTAVIKVK
ncbi:MAG: hypothetical protein U5N86_04930 [Planctomycetota bacterium]|nr:hypothetical protein [Planctomycetota bacterium]